MTETRTIMVVDDEEGDRLGISTILERAGFHVVTAGGGREALRVYADNPVQAIVTDIMMTDGDGTSLISLIKSLEPSTPIVAVSGKGQIPLRLAEVVGADQALQKPVDPEMLIEAVETALGKPRD